MLFPCFHKRGFTVTELLVAVGLISLLAVVLLSAFTRLQGYKAHAKCVANLKNIGAATYAYAADHAGALPLYAYRTENGSTGSGALGGTWYYNLAPYLGIPRTEVADPNTPSSERTYLGTVEQRIQAPCVFTCPAHSKNESNESWAPTPMTFPAAKPVSYAPPTYVKNMPDDAVPLKLYPRRLSEIRYPGRKFWLLDSSTPNIFNASASRWKADGANNTAYQAFNRHQGGGNALFFDGHVEWFPYQTFLDLKMIAVYFATDADIQ